MSNPNNIATFSIRDHDLIELLTTLESALMRDGAISVDSWNKAVKKAEDAK